MAYNVHIISSLSLEGIQSLMMCGRVSQAVSIVNRLHPGLFESNQELLFRVLCHQFIETIAGYDTLPGRGGESRENGELEDDSMETESNGITMIDYASNSYIHVVTPINSYIHVVTPINSYIHVVTPINSYIHVVTPINSYNVVTPINLDKDPGAVEQLLLFGRELQSLYNQISKRNHQSESPGHHQLQTLLQDVFSLLAYADPLSSPVAYLLDPSQREPVTAALNSAILSKRERERSGGMIIVMIVV